MVYLDIPKKLQKKSVFFVVQPCCGNIKSDFGLKNYKMKIKKLKLDFFFFDTRILNKILTVSLAVRCKWKKYERIKY
jgi:hypothetical protein